MDLTAISPLKFTIVGDGTVGKTCILMRYTDQEFNGEMYIPTVFDNKKASINNNGQDYEVDLFDTAGQEDYARLRPLSYPGTSCFILCFSVNNKASYENITAKWVPELKHHAPHVPILLVGSKKDLRQGNNELQISHGDVLKRKINAYAYVECSALSGEGIDDVMLQALKAATQRPKTGRSIKPKCTLL